jgi:hypothetical protein
MMSSFAVNLCHKLRRLATDMCDLIHLVQSKADDADDHSLKRSLPSFAKIGFFPGSCNVKGAQQMLCPWPKEGEAIVRRPQSAEGDLFQGRVRASHAVEDASGKFGDGAGDADGDKGENEAYRKHHDNVQRPCKNKINHTRPLFPDVLCP